MTAATAASQSTLLCDTSFVSVMQGADRNKDLIGAWPPGTRRRIDESVLAVSVITIAELRAGHEYADWQPPRRQRAEAVIGAYLHIPLDMVILDRWAQLWAACRSNGHNIPHNDLWIAATALTRGWPLVSCDRHFDSIPDLEHLYLPPTLTT